MAGPDDFRRIALALPGAEERSHMSHPDFRVGGRIFATLGVPDVCWGMVKLLPDEQEVLMQLYPDVFRPATGAWGRSGSTLVRLEIADEVLETAIGMAWRNQAPAKLRR